MLDNGTVILDEQNEPQPDAILRFDESRGGSSQVNDKGYVVGPPELHVEVAYSSESIDLHLKRAEYERTGVREYLVLLLREECIRAFRLEEGRYVDHPADESGLWRSHLFPGLWLNVPALLKRNGTEVLKTLQQGVDSPEHSAFAHDFLQNE